MKMKTSMKCFTSLVLALALLGTAVAKDHPTTITVTDGKEQHAGMSLHQRFVITAKDQTGITFLLSPENRKDMLLPGIYQARIARRRILVCVTKDNGKCRDLKFHVLSAVRNTQ